MTRTITALTPLLAATLTLAACVPVTINVNFPQEKIENAASSIENMVRTPPPPPASVPAPGPATPGQPPSGQGSGTHERRFAPSPAPTATAPGREVGAVAVEREGGVVSLFIPGVAEAQVPELKTQTPEVTAAVASRRDRLGQLSAAMAKGCIGENNRGLVEARPGSDCPGNVGALVAGENRDRMLIYRTLVEQNNMAPGDLERVQRAFAKIDRERAAPGTWVQNPDGQWTRR
jgi:uncharacterized protein YdbL (DUF1318 family)